MLLAAFVLLVMLGLTMADGGGGSNLCSSMNTGSDSKVHVSVYQSTGLCQDSCSGYAYAILQGKSCWCSNYAPGDTGSSGDCDESCPGFPDDKCGSSNKGMFNYILLSTPSGTKSASSASSSSTSSSKSSSTSSSTTTSSSSSSTTMRTTSKSDQVSVVTITGKQETRTVKATSSDPTGVSGAGMHSSPTESATMSKDKQDDDNKDSFFDNKGKVAGTFTAVGLVAAALILALIFFLCYRKRKRAEAEGGQTPSSYSGHSPNPLNEKGATGLQRDQSNATTLAGIGYDEKGRLDNTTIVPITVDQRLDPGQMFMRWDQNDSRRSLQDEHDYSRKLRVTNPDYDRNSSLYDE